MAAYSQQQDEELARLQELSNKWESDATVCFYLFSFTVQWGMGIPRSMVSICVPSVGTIPLTAILFPT
jgi:hypothetical protein